MPIISCDINVLKSGEHDVEDELHGKLFSVELVSYARLNENIILWKHHVSLLSQSFRSVTSDLHQWK